MTLYEFEGRHNNRPEGTLRKLARLHRQGHCRHGQGKLGSCWCRAEPPIPAPLAPGLTMYLMRVELPAMGPSSRNFPCADIVGGEGMTSPCAVGNPGHGSSSWVVSGIGFEQAPIRLRGRRWLQALVRSLERLDVANDALEVLPFASTSDRNVNHVRQVEGQEISLASRQWWTSATTHTGTPPPPAISPKAVIRRPRF